MLLCLKVSELFPLNVLSYLKVLANILQNLPLLPPPRLLVSEFFSYSSNAFCHQFSKLVEPRECVGGNLWFIIISSGAQGKTWTCDCPLNWRHSCGTEPLPCGIWCCLRVDSCQNCRTPSWCWRIAWWCGEKSIGIDIGPGIFYLSSPQSFFRPFWLILISFLWNALVWILLLCFSRTV